MIKCSLMDMLPRSSQHSTNLHTAFREVESLLDHGCQLTNTTTLFSQDILGPGGQNNDLGTDGGHADLNTTVTVFSQLTS